MSGAVLPGATIGIIGGGQLGRMLALEARRMGYRIAVLDPAASAPAHRIADERIVAAYNDPGGLRRLKECADVVTFEFENIDAEALANFEREFSRGRVAPASSVLRVTQNRVAEKTFLSAAGLPVADFVAIGGQEDLKKHELLLQNAGVLKTASGGYDGKGQWRVSSILQVEEALVEAQGRPLIWERLVRFKAELSVVAARAVSGEIVVLPVAENTHVQGILDVSVVPARVADNVAQLAAQMAQRVAQELKFVGVLCVELFLLEDDSLLVNEIAPRPHNSGHFSLDACSISQFELQLRAVCGLPLGEPKLLSPAVMLNLLGSGMGDRLQGIEQVLQIPGACLHLYDKGAALAGRKMGHVTLLNSDTGAALRDVERVRSILKWEA